MTTTLEVQCPRCHNLVPDGRLTCPHCGELTYTNELNELASRAEQLEATQPVLAAALWRQCLAYLPPESPDHAAIATRAGDLAAGFAPPPPIQVQAVRRQPRREPRSDDFMAFLLKTGGSMALSIWLFSNMAGWTFAIAFVLLIFIHEMGHVIANWYFGLKQSAPIFLGYFGAIIFLRDDPPDATAEGIVGIAGPIAGTLGAVACMALYHKTGIAALQFAAVWAFFMNAWNLLPVPPLDGGRATAALSPFLWAAGLVGLVGTEVFFFIRHGSGIMFSVLILLWILQSSIGRIRHALLNGGWRARYYKTSIATRLLMLLAYGGLIAFLVPQIMHYRRLIF